MPLILTPEILKEIADQLDKGMLCFYNIKTGELESVPDENRLPGYDEEPWADALEKIDENYGDYVRFEGMDSHESFRIMEGFVDEMPNNEVRNRFIHALEQRKPFQQFKSLLHYYPHLLEQWYVYKTQCYIEFVKKIADAYDR